MTWMTLDTPRREKGGSATIVRWCAYLALLAAILQGGARADVLITRAEAALPAAPADAGYAERGVGRGPEISLVGAPELTLAVTTPFHLQIGFKAHGGARIESASAEVTYLKDPAVDLTARLKAHATAAGIDLPKAEAPLGEHRLRVSVTDSDGHTTSKDMIIKVRR